MPEWAPPRRRLPPRDLKCAWRLGKMDDQPVLLDLNARYMSMDEAAVVNGLRESEMIPNRLGDQRLDSIYWYAAH